MGFGQVGLKKTQCPDLKTELLKRSASCPNSQLSWLVQPLRIGDKPRSGQIRTISEKMRPAILRPGAWLRSLGLVLCV